MVVAGVLAEEQITPFLSAECDGRGFIPSQIGLDDLQPTMINYPSSDDHVWHTVVEGSFKPTSAKPTIDLTAGQLALKFKMVMANWDVVGACKRHGFTL